LVWLAAQLGTLYLTAHSADGSLLCSFRDVAAARRTFRKTTVIALGLIGPTTLVTAFDLSTINTEFNTRRISCAGFAARFIRLLTAIDPQQGNN
jgi:hypothetical protein